MVKKCIECEYDDCVFNTSYIKIDDRDYGDIYVEEFGGCRIFNKTGKIRLLLKKDGHYRTLLARCAHQSRDERKLKKFLEENKKKR